jgi:uncharacterized protein (DUF2235 family)
VIYDDYNSSPPTAQIIYYASGIGTDGGDIQRVSDGATGAGLANKVEEAYAFIAGNYVEGDEVRLR